MLRAFAAVVVIVATDTDAVSAVSAYSKQSTQLGLREPRDKPATCSMTRAPDGLLVRGVRFPAPEAFPTTQGVQCQASYLRRDLGISITVWVCRSCVHPTAEAQLIVQRVPQDFRTGEAEFLAATQPITPLPNASPTARLDERDRKEARVATPSARERFTNDLKVVEFPRLVKGSEALAPALAFQRCETGDLEAVVRITGNTRDVVSAFLRQSDEPRNAASGRTAVVDGVQVTQYRYAYYTTLVVVDDPRSPDPIGVFEWCND